MFIITEVFLDESDRYRARVIINNDTKETTFFKFDHYPSQEEVDIVAQKYLDNLSEINNIIQ